MGVNVIKCPVLEAAYFRLGSGSEVARFKLIADKLPVEVCFPEAAIIH